MLGTTPTVGWARSSLFTCFGGPVINPSGGRFQGKSVTLSATPTSGSY